MKYLQKVKVTLQEGKASKEKVGKIIAVVDGVADRMVIDGENLLKLKKNGVFTVYEEAKKADKVAQDRKDGKPDPKAKPAAKTAKTEVK